MKIASTIIALLVGATITAQSPQFTVTGTATKQVDADEMIINVGYQAEGKNAREVFERTQISMAEAIEYLNGREGVKKVESDIIRLNRRYNHGATQQPFVAIQTLSITLSDFNMYETVMIKLMDFGFNTVGGVRFAVSNLSDLKEELQLQAIKEARKKATLYAKSLGVELGGVLNFAENQLGGGPSPVYNYRAADGVAANGPSIAPQQVEITMQVVVSYAIKNE
jgi:uncharacterized protein YggE